MTCEDSLTQAEEDLVEHAQLGEAEEKDAASQHEGVFGRLSLALLSLALATLEQGKPRSAQCLIDVLIGEHGVHVLPHFGVLPAQHEAAIVVALSLLVLGAHPAPAIFEAHLGLSSWFGFLKSCSYVIN